MINIRINLDSNGCVKVIEARGHSSEGIKGQNVLCGAVTVLLKSAAKVIYSDNTIKSSGTAEEPGNLYFKIVDLPVERRSWVKGITDILIAGLFDLEGQFKNEINVILE